MKKIFVLLDFIELAVAEKISFYRNVIAKLTGNATYPTPDKPLTEAKTDTDNLETAYINAKDGSHTLIAKMRAAEATADNLFRILAAYVERIADGDEAKILSSGFHPSKQPASIQKPELTATNGSNLGSVKLVAKAIDGAGAYIWQQAKDNLPANDSGWTIAGHSTVAHFEITGLQQVSKYWFRVAAITPTGTTNYTAPVMKVVE